LAVFTDLTLPDRPNLRHLKDQAKDLVKAGTAKSITEAQFKIARDTMSGWMKSSNARRWGTRYGFRTSLIPTEAARSRSCENREPSSESTTRESPDDLREIDNAALQVTVNGARYPEQLQQMTER